MRTPKLKPEMEKLPLVQRSRAIDRVCDAADARKQPDLDDLKVACDWLRLQQISNLKRGLFKSCDECGAEITKEGCANCLRKAIERVLNDSESKHGGWGPDITLREVLQNALKASSPNDKVSDGSPL